MDDRRIAIIGGGPVGLLCALCALAEGLRPTVYDRRSGARAGTLAMSVHPPALEILERLGVAARFTARGVRVSRGIAYGARGALGSVDLGSCSGAHRYVLNIPQAQIQSLLREALEERAPGSVAEGHELVSYYPTRDGVSLEMRHTDGRRLDRHAGLLVACDGKRSLVRNAGKIDFAGGPYDGAYALCDFPDATSLGSDAAVFLGPGGLVHSSPLPGGLRRWVIRRDADARGDAHADELVETIARRTGHRITSADGLGVTSFRAEHYLASTLVSPGVALAGDAAHVISPIGGQGMNLGWLGAADLVAEVARAMRSRLPMGSSLALNAAKRRRIAWVATRRAELNLWLGKPTHGASARERVVRALLRRPVTDVLATWFTMRGP